MLRFMSVSAELISGKPLKKIPAHQTSDVGTGNARLVFRDPGSLHTGLTSGLFLAVPLPDNPDRDRGTVPVGFTCIP